MIQFPTLMIDEDDEDTTELDAVRDICSGDYPTLCITVEGIRHTDYTNFETHLEEHGFVIIHKDTNLNTLENGLTFWYKNGSNKYEWGTNDNCDCCGFLNASRYETLEHFIERLSNFSPFNQVILVTKEVFSHLESIPFVHKIAEIKAINEPFVLFQFIGPEDMDQKLKTMNMNDKQTYVMSAIQEANQDKAIYSKLKEYRGLVVGKTYSLNMGGSAYNKAKVKIIEKFCDVAKYRLDVTGYYGNISEFNVNVKDTQSVSAKEVK